MRNARNMIARADLIADALAATIAELRLVDAGDFIAYIRAGQWANIADLVDSSAELSFQDGALSFACQADFALGWDQTPSISLDLEFQSFALSAFFTLTLGRRHSAVELKSLWFAVEPDDEAEGTRLLKEALATARLATEAPEWIFFARR